ncbi:hypothetical protein B9Z55_021872 [Caenorhabditis nigoni]|nr:hypothetical protein B9Z55_021872 [Caenorhabditis nigoni]
MVHRPDLLLTLLSSIISVPMKAKIEVCKLAKCNMKKLKMNCNIKILLVREQKMTDFYKNNAFRSPPPPASVADPREAPQLDLSAVEAARQQYRIELPTRRRRRRFVDSSRHKKNTMQISGA